TSRGAIFAWKLPPTSCANSAYGDLSVKRTTSGSTFSTLSTMEKTDRAGDAVAGLRMRVNVYTTSSASSSRPWWNFTPLRSLKVHTLASGEDSQLSASSGFGDSVWSVQTRLS